MAYVTHARTPEQLRAEVISDLNRRIEFLQGQHNVTARSKAEKSRLACAMNELGNMLDFWTKLTIAGSKLAK